MSDPSPERSPSTTDGPPTSRAVTVVGGTYRETCVEPAIDALRGSGLRAAALLASLGHPTQFHTCIDTESQAEADAQHHALNLTNVTSAERRTPVTFAYDTPVSPARWGYSGERGPIDVTATCVVAFGMIDATWSVEADRVVLDPQHGDLDVLLDRTTATSVALILNAHEARRITGQSAADAGRTLLASHRVDVVVIKQGALGGLVFTPSTTSAYGPIPTTATRTIGSGDAFTAGFAHAWFNDTTAPLTAAAFGAQVAAAHSMTDVPQVSDESLASLPEPLPHPGPHPPKIYIAAPFFSTAERLLIDTVRHALHDAGLRVFSPLHDVGKGGDEVAAADLDGLRDANAVLALLDGGDPGTVFETGWATHANIPVVAFTDNPIAHDWTMLRGTGTPITADLTSAVHSAAWAAIRHATQSNNPPDTASDRHADTETGTQP